MLKGLHFTFLLLITSHLAFSENAESSRILIHTLNYLSQDYAGAVKDGKIISATEFREMQQFGESSIKYFNECSPNWSDSDSAAIRVLIYRLDSLIEKHAPFNVVSTSAIQVRNKIITASGLKITPETYPSLENGKVVFKTECAKCHGQNGSGDGPEGKELNPKPKNFLDDEKIKPVSPFFVFNTVRLGVEGTGMKAHTTLDDDEVWNVAFYVLSMRYQQYTDSSGIKNDDIKGLIDSIPLEKIATTSDEDFLKLYSIKDSAKAKLLLAAIRLNQPAKDNSEFITTSLKYLDGAMDLYSQGKYHEASQLAILSYLEGIEPIEMQLKSNDPRLMSKLEEQLQRVSRLMEQQKPQIEIKDSLNEVKKSIHAASEILSKKEYSFLLALLMAVSILLREGLEAFLVIMVILSILKSANLKNAARWVHGGWIVAVLAGVVMWIIGGSLLKGQIEHMELLEGVISIVAVFMLLFVGFWLHGKSEINKWKDYVTKMMQGAVKSESMIGLASLSFFVVFREVFESVLFLSAINIESAGKQTNAIILGVVIAFVVVITLAVILLRFSTRLPVPQLFKISSLVMSLLAIVLAGKGIHSLQETGYVAIHGIPIIRMELIGVFPTIETCLAQLAVIIVVVVVWNSSKKKVK